MSLTPPIDPELARRIRVVVFDADGVLTDGGIYISDGTGEPFGSRRFHVRDGVGVFMLRRAGLVVAIVSGKLSAAVRARADELGMEEVHQVDPYDKLSTVEGILSRAGAGWDEVAFVADDIADLPVLRQVALPCAVPDGAAEVQEAAAWTSSKPGGQGAVREFAEALLGARGEWESLVEAYVDECEARWKAGRDA
jgi:3-deoxy-D-manno-octulosonate 8-phosphate phosphatase (KDO 8-P phosphatase)